MLSNRAQLVPDNVVRMPSPVERAPNRAGTVPACLRSTDCDGDDVAPRTADGRSAARRLRSGLVLALVRVLVLLLLIMVLHDSFCWRWVGCMVCMLVVRVCCVRVFMCGV